MNRYLIAALYVMAGCVVAVPLKVQGSPEPLRGERCRLVITAGVEKEWDAALVRPFFMNSYEKGLLKGLFNKIIGKLGRKKA